MKRKSDAFHLDILTQSKNPYALLRNSYREDGKVKGEIDVNTHCYDTMDRLFEHQEAIQQTLAKKHLEDGMLVLYDITSSYMEGEYADSELVCFGYKRDQKRGHEQIVISLLCSREGCPVAVEVFRGNTKDETTVLDKIGEVKEKYGIRATQPRYRQSYLRPDPQRGPIVM